MSVPGAAPSDPKIDLLRARLQSLMRKHGFALEDPQTAAVFRATLEAARLIALGAYETGAMSGYAHGVMNDTIDDAQEAVALFM